MENLQKAEKLFNQAIKLPPKERQDFLEKTCAEDIDTKQTVIGMIKNFDEVSHYFQSLKLSWSNDFDYTDAQLGPYKMKRLIGEGGMGKVYLGERNDGLYEQEVAVKILKVNSYDSAPIDNREQQILADLDHPGIAKIFNAGKTDSNQTYLVMEFVRGIPIEKHVESEKLDAKQIGQLMLQIGKAVQHAHQNRVIHRDLKPSNILVTKDGIPKLLDFGISVLDHDLEQENLQHIITPNYCAPEQIEGSKQINVTTDVYLLGVLFYKLLSGKTPFELNGLSYEERKEKIKNEVPPTITQSINEDSVLVKDFDIIINKALKKKQKDRYQSVDAMMTDINAALGNYPLTGNSNNPKTQLKKSIIRNKWKVASAVIALLILIIFTGFYTYNLNKQKLLANREAQKAESIKNYLIEIINLSDPYTEYGPDISVKQMLNMAYTKIDEKFTNDPYLRAEIYSELGLIMANYKETEKATKILTKAIELNDKLYGSESKQNVDLYAALCGAYNQYKDSLAYQYGKRAINLAIKHYGQSSLKLAPIIAEFSTNYYARTEERDTLCVKALEIAENSPGDNRMLIAQILHNCSSWRKSIPGGAIENKERALKLARQAKGDDHPLVGEILNDLSLAYDKVDLSKSLALGKEAYRVASVNLGATHPNSLAILNNLAVTCRELNLYEDALHYHRMVADSLKKHHPKRKRSLAFATFGIAKSLKHLNNSDEAIYYLKRTISNFEQGDTEQYLSHITIVDMEIAKIYLENNELDKAREQLNSFKDRVFSENAKMSRHRENAADLWAEYYSKTKQKLPEYIAVYN